MMPRAGSWVRLLVLLMLSAAVTVACEPADGVPDEAGRAAIEDAVLLDLRAEYEDLVPRAEVETQPSTSVGTLEGALQVTPSGDANYRVPIHVAPGRAGMQPNLSLVYDSSAGNGLLGVGWRLDGLSAVLPCADPVSDSDRLCLDGKPLVAVGWIPPGYMEAPNQLVEYRTVPNEFHRIIRSIPTGDIDVYTRDRRRLKYGEEPVERTNDLEKAKGRLLNLVSDRAGNTMRIKYTGEVYDHLGTIGEYKVPSRIEYTSWFPWTEGIADELVEAKRSVVFEYNNAEPEHYREDPEFLQSGELAGRMVRLLTAIQINGPNGPVRRYRLTYQSSQTSGRSLLKAITECDGKGVCKPATTFTYSTGSPDFIEKPTNIKAAFFEGNSGSEAPSTKQKIAVADLDGDGHDDLVYFRHNFETEGNWYYHLASPGPGFPVGEQKLGGERPNRFVVTPNVDSTGSSVVYFHDKGADRIGFDVDQAKITLSEVIGGDDRFDLTAQLDLNGDSILDFVGCRSSRWEARMGLGGGHFGDPLSHSKYGCEESQLSVATVGPGSIQRLTRQWISDDELHVVEFGVRSKSDECGQISCVQLENYFDPLNSDLVFQPFDNGHEPIPGAFYVDVNGDGSRTPISLCPTSLAHALALDWDQDGGDEILFPTGGKCDQESWTKDVAGMQLRDYHLCAPEGFEHDCYDSTKTTLPGPWRDEDGVPHGQMAHAVGDFNGDGLADVVAADADLGELVVYLRESATPDSAQADRLVRVTDGLGAHRRIEYRPMTDRDVYRGPAPTCPVFDAGDLEKPTACTLNARALVRAVYSGRGEILDDADEARRVYRFHNEHFDRRASLSLGFEKIVTQVQALGDDGWETGTTHVQEFDHSNYNEDLLAFPDARLLWRETFISHDGGIQNLVQRTETRYETFVDDVGLAGTPVYHVSLGSQRRAEYEWFGAAVDVDAIDAKLDSLQRRRDEVVLFDDYDAFANPGVVTSLASDGTKRTRVVEYKNDVDVNRRWLIGLPKRETLISSTPTFGARTRTQTFVHDEHGRVTENTLEPDDGLYTQRTTLEYDKFGNIRHVSVDDLPPDDGPLVAPPDLPARELSIEYWAADGESMFPWLRTNSLGHSEITVFHSGLGVPVLHRDANSLITTRQLDGFGRVVGEVGPDGRSMKRTFGRSFDANKTTPTTPFVRTEIAGGLDQTDFYDRLGRVVQTNRTGWNGQPVVKSTQYDQWGRLESESAPGVGGPGDAGWRSYSYDLMGRPVRFSSPGVADTRFFYAGFNTIIETENGRRITQTKDAHGRLRASRDALGGLICYEYGPFDDLATIRNLAGEGGIRDCESADGGETTSRTTDRYGRVTRLEDPQQGVRRYQYDGFGQLIAAEDGAGTLTQYRYDDLGRLVERENPDGLSFWRWDIADGQGKNGLLRETESPDGYSETFLYDQYSRPFATLYEDVGYASWTATLYDEYGRLERLYYPAAVGVPLFSVDYEYDQAGQVAAVSDAVSGHEFWRATSRNSHGALTSERFGNGLVGTRVYDADTQALVQIHTFGQMGKGAVQDLEYEYDNLGNLETRADHLRGQFETFEYDVLNRLRRWTTVAGGAAVEKNVFYNRFGDIIYKTGVGNYEYGPDGANPRALLGTELHDYEYDADGRQIVRDDVSIDYTAMGKPRRMEGPEELLEFRYSAGGGRVSRKSEAKKTETRYVGEFYERESIDSIVPTTHHKYRVVAEGRVVAQVTRTRRPFFSTTTRTHYVHHDNMGSADAVTDEAGDLEQAMSFDPFGDARDPLWNGGDVFSNSAGINVGYTGHDEVPDFGLINMRGRQYDPEVARFASADPFFPSPGHTQGLNRFSYVYNNPFSFSDPSGFGPCDGYFGCSEDSPGSLPPGTIPPSFYFWEKLFEWFDGLFNSNPNNGQYPGPGNGNDESERGHKPEIVANNWASGGEDGGATTRGQNNGGAGSLAARTLFWDPLRSRINVTVDWAVGKLNGAPFTNQDNLNLGAGFFESGGETLAMLNSAPVYVTNMFLGGVVDLNPITRTERLAGVYDLVERDSGAYNVGSLGETLGELAIGAGEVKILAKNLKFLVSARGGDDLVRVFRVEGFGNQRLVTAPGQPLGVQGNQMLFLNFGNEARALQLLERRLGQGFSDTVIKWFHLPRSAVDDLTRGAVPESLAHSFPNAPIIVDTSKAAGQYGLRVPQIELLRALLRGL